MAQKLIKLTISAFLLFAMLFPCYADDFQYQETKDIVNLVQNAAVLLQTKSKTAFFDFKTLGTPWYHDETYIFVMDYTGNMLCHPDPTLEGKNLYDLKDINGRPFIQQMIKKSGNNRKNNRGWVHYLWPRPGKLFPVWKSAYVMQVTDPYGKRYIIGSGLYEMKPEKRIIADGVDDAAFLIEGKGDSALDILKDKNQNVLFGNIYLFVDSKDGTEIINPAFPEIEGTNIINFTDSTGKPVVKDYINLADSQNSGWIDYMWPKPGEDTPSKKSTYVRKTRYGDNFLVVGCGLYFDQSAPTQEVAPIDSAQLISHIREAGNLVKTEGEKSFPKFREHNSSWFNGDNYIFIMDMNRKRAVYPPNPSIEGEDISNLLDPRGRNIGKQLYSAVDNKKGEGWAYYEWDRPAAAYPCWKSTYLVKAKAPSGQIYLVGGGAYNMKTDEIMIVDRVEKAAALVEKEGRAAFVKLRDKLGEFVFLDNYVFVDDLSGLELVNPGFPNLEGQNLINTQDTNGKYMVKEYIDLANNSGSGWVEYMWPKPGTDQSSKKRTYVKRVKSGDEYFIIGCGAFIN